MKHLKKLFLFWILPFQLSFAEEGGGDGGEGGSGEGEGEGSGSGEGSLVGKTGEGSGSEGEGSQGSQGDYRPFSIYDDGKVSDKFLSTLSEEDKGLRKFFEKYAGSDDPEKNMLQGIKNLQYLAGQKALEPLPDDAPDSVKEERRQLMAKLNSAPDTAEGYGLDKAPEGLPEGYEWPTETAKKYAEVFHKHGASPELVRDLMALEGEVATQKFNESNLAQEEAIQTRKKEEMGKLTTEFGDETDKVLQDAVRGGLTLGMEQAEVESILTTAASVKAFAKVVSLVSEDKLVTQEGQQGTGGMTYRDQAMDILNNPSNPLHKAYHDASDPQHDRAVRTRSELNRKHAEQQKRMGSR